MTARKYIAVLLLGQVLVCPFFGCRECPGECRADDVRSESACGCCGDGCEEEQPAPDDRRCPCGTEYADCFCRGAIRTDVVDCPVPADGGSFRGVAAHAGFADSGVRAIVSVSDRLLIRSSHSPPLVSGKALCALTQTYLL